MALPGLQAFVAGAFAAALARLEGEQEQGPANGAAAGEEAAAEPLLQEESEVASPERPNFLPVGGRAGAAAQRCGAWRRGSAVLALQVLEGGGCSGEQKGPASLPSPTHWAAAVPSSPLLPCTQVAEPSEEWLAAREAELEAEEAADLPPGFVPRGRCASPMEKKLKSIEVRAVLWVLREGRGKEGRLGMLRASAGAPCLGGARGEWGHAAAKRLPDALARLLCTSRAALHLHILRAQEEYWAGVAFDPKPHVSRLEREKEAAKASSLAAAAAPAPKPAAAEPQQPGLAETLRVHKSRWAGCANVGGVG